MPSSRDQKTKAPGHQALLYGRGVKGKFRFRVRHRHIAEHLAPLIANKGIGAAKLDLLLRGIALQPEHVGRRGLGAVGLVLSEYSYEDLHDLVRNPDRFGPAFDQVEYPPQARRSKRKWVGEQLERLEELELVRRTDVRGRPEVFVLSDTGSGDPLDDPTGRQGHQYITVHGTLFSTTVIREWGAPELCFYLAAMVGEGYDRSGKDSKERATPGSGTWFRPLDWFADPLDRRPEDHIRIPFTVPTLERGLRSLRDQNYVASKLIRRDPRTGKTFKRPRNLYQNYFSTLEWGDKAQQPLIREFLQQLGEMGDPSLLEGLLSDTNLPESQTRGVSATSS